MQELILTGNISAVERLLDLGESPMAVYNNQCILLTALEHKQYEIASLLLDHLDTNIPVPGRIIDCVYKSENEALISRIKMLSFKNSDETFKAAIKHNIDEILDTMNIEDKYFSNIKAIYLARSRGYIINYDKNLETDLFFYCIDKNDYNTLLLFKTPDLDIYCNKLEEYAKKIRNEDIAFYLFNKIYNWNYSRAFDFAEELLEAGMILNPGAIHSLRDISDKYKIFDLVKNKDNIEDISEIESVVGNVSGEYKNGSFDLIFGAFSGDIDRMKRALEIADIEDKFFGITALEAAVRTNKIEAVQFILSIIDPDYTVNFDLISFALKLESDEIFKLLIDFYPLSRNIGLILGNLKNINQLKILLDYCRSINFNINNLYDLDEKEEFGELLLDYKDIVSQEALENFGPYCAIVLQRAIQNNEEVDLEIVNNAILSKTNNCADFLRYAIRHNFLQVIHYETFLEEEALDNLKVVVSEGVKIPKTVLESAFVMASKHSDLEAIDLFFDKGANINSSFRWKEMEIPYRTDAITAATINNDIKTISHLLSKDPKINIANGLIVAAENGFFEAFVKLYKFNNNIDRLFLNSIAESACKNGLTSIIRMLLENHNIKDLDNPQKPLSSIAFENWHFNLVEFLLLNGGFCNLTLNEAIKTNRIKAVQFVFENFYDESDINLENEDRETPLTTACKLGRGDIIRYIIDKGAHIEIDNLNNIARSVNESSIDIAVEILKMIVNEKEFDDETIIYMIMDIYKTPDPIYHFLLFREALLFGVEFTSSNCHFFSTDKCSDYDYKALAMESPILMKHYLKRSELRLYSFKGFDIQTADCIPGMPMLRFYEHFTVYSHILPRDM